MHDKRKECMLAKTQESWNEPFLTYQITIVMNYCSMAGFVPVGSLSSIYVIKISID